jgi:two-component system, NarL family, nitrate/nitrite response regulator NarL
MLVVLFGEPGIEREGMRLLLSDEGHEVLIWNSVELSLAGESMPPANLVLIDRSVANAENLCERLSKASPDIPVAVMVTDPDGETVRRLALAGALGIVDRNASRAIAMNQLLATALGQRVVPARFIEDVLRCPAPIISQDVVAISHGLSERERVVAACLGRGMSNKMIARELGLSEPTIKVHVKAILRKMNVRNRTEAALQVVVSRERQ